MRHLKPNSSVELGSLVGISASYQAAALQLNGKGRLVTLEGSPESARIAAETLEQLGITTAKVIPGPFHQTLGKTLESARPVDYLFNDGHHDREAVLRYFHQSLPFLADHAVMLFDDITWSPGMMSAWIEIQKHPRVRTAISLRTIGIAVIGSEQSAQEHFMLPI